MNRQVGKSKANNQTKKVQGYKQGALVDSNSTGIRETEREMKIRNKKNKGKNKNKK
jgi:hypothetical protein